MGYSGNEYITEAFKLWSQIQKCNESNIEMIRREAKAGIDYCIILL